MDDSDLSLDTVSIGMHVRILAEGDEPDLSLIHISPCHQECLSGQSDPLWSC